MKRNMYGKQGYHYLQDVKFKDFSMTFEDLFKRIKLKCECFTHIF